MAPMSTTANLSVAVHYGISKGSLLFQLKVENFMQATLSHTRHRASESPAPTGA